METPTLVVHIAAGCIAILAGYVAVFVAKGGDLHRRAGTLFVWAMIVMGVTATAVAALRGITGSLLGGAMVAYFTVTAWTTVKPIDRRLDIAMLVVALSISALCFVGAAQAAAQGSLTAGGPQKPMSLFLGCVLLLAALADVRILVSGAPSGPRRIGRHLWRMCFAFWAATASFFLGQMDEFPKFLQKPALMAIPAMLPLLLMAYWLWRVRVRSLLPVSIPTTEYPQ